MRIAGSWVGDLFPRLQLIWVDGTYRGDSLASWVKQTCGWVLSVVTRQEDQKGFEVLPRRWVVERTFAWFGRYRRLSKDYEYLPTKARNHDLYRND